jgi:hypothetical protein
LKILTKETRWSRTYQVGRHYFTGESKFVTGDAEITLDVLAHEWPGWNPEERSDFLQSFRAKDDEQHQSVFRYLVAHANPSDRQRFHGLLTGCKNHEAAFQVATQWLHAPETENRKMLILPVFFLSQYVGTEKGIAAIRKILDEDLDNGRFWDFSKWTRHIAEDRAFEVFDCLTSLYRLTKDKQYLDMVERLRQCPDPYLATWIEDAMVGLALKEPNLSFTFRRICGKLRAVLGL